MRTWFDGMFEMIEAFNSDIEQAKNDVEAGIIVQMFIQRLRSSLEDFESSLEGKHKERE